MENKKPSLIKRVLKVLGFDKWYGVAIFTALMVFCYCMGKYVIN